MKDRSFETALLYGTPKANIRERATSLPDPQLNYSHYYTRLEQRMKRVHDYSEAQIEDMLYEFFSKHFDVERQLWSDCGKSRCDLMLYDYNRESFGIEIKKAGQKRGVELGDHINQAYEYATNRTWRGKSGVKFFLFPQISALYLDYTVNSSSNNIVCKPEHHPASTMLSTWGLGEVMLYPKYSDLHGKHTDAIGLVYAGKTLWHSNV